MIISEKIRIVEGGKIAERSKQNHQEASLEDLFTRHFYSSKSSWKKAAAAGYRKEDGVG
jgi:hypothetical protein